MWIPRRHRSLVYKLLILIPVAWLTIAFLMYNGNTNALNNAAAAVLPDAAAVVAGNSASGSGNGGSATGANAAVAAGDSMPGGGVSATVKILPVEDR